MPSSTAKLLALGKKKNEFFVLLSFIRNIAVFDGEITGTRQKKE